jgi:DNA repair exonuclease SbcCD ATPase subunit
MPNHHLTVTEASKRFNIDRSRLYRAFKSGELSRNADGTVQLVELLRVFGGVQKNVQSVANEHNERSREHIEQTKNSLLYKAQEDKIRLLEESLRQAQERERTYLDREEWQRGQIEKLTDTIKLLEAPKTQTISSYKWWKFWRNS